MLELRLFVKSLLTDTRRKELYVIKVSMAPRECTNRAHGVRVVYVCVALVLIVSCSFGASTASQAAPGISATPAQPAASSPVVAFPGAEGFGAETPGGRSGRIIYVSTLADAGPGSLRAALEARGPRTVLFSVAGTITLQDDITIKEPFLTVAGQTAPGEGVQIRGGMIKIQTHDVVIRHLRMRPGDAINKSNNDDRDALTLAGNRGAEVFNVVLDHCSMVWGPDIGGMAILTNVHDITVQNTIMGEGLYLSNHSEATVEQNGHSLGMNITQLDDSAYPRRLTLHHNLFTTADHRMPQIIGGESVDMVNNVIYNWGTNPAHGSPRSLNLINNMFIKGPMTTELLAWKPRTTAKGPELLPGSVYEQGTVTEGFTTVRGDPQSVYAAARFTPYSLTTEQTAQEAYTRVISEAGAILPLRDSADQRIIDNLLQRTGAFPNGSDLVWPELASGPVSLDSDQDGMPDAWEQQHFGTTSRGAADDSSGDYDQDGYTDVEEYLNCTDPNDRGDLPINEEPPKEAVYQTWLVLLQAP